MINQTDDVIDEKKINLQEVRQAVQLEPSLAFYADINAIRFNYSNNFVKDLKQARISGINN